MNEGFWLRVSHWIGLTMAYVFVSVFVFIGISSGNAGSTALAQLADISLYVTSAIYIISATEMVGKK